MVKAKWIKCSTLFNNNEELGFWQRPLGANPILTEPDLMRVPHSLILRPRLTSPSSDLNLSWGVFPSAALWLMALYDSVQMMGIWVTTFLLAWLQVQKKYLAGKNMQWEWSYTMCWQQNCPEKLTSLPFPSPSFSPLCRSSLHMSLFSCQFPGGSWCESAHCSNPG